MQVFDFNYTLPPELIAQQPLADRAASRLLHLQIETARLADRSFREFPELLRPGDLLILNNTRVFPARLFGHRKGIHAQPVSLHNPAAREFLHGRIEVLLTKQISPDSTEWECLVRPGRKLGIGEQIFFGENGELAAEVIGRGEFGERHIRFAPVPDFFARIEKLGHVPLPPYIDRDDALSDRDRYQTVYAKTRGSVAAPTAGLHFTPEIFDCLHQRGIETAEITLHVGLGTFQPVHTEKVEDHKLHTETYDISESTASHINQAIADKRRIVAVGTTTVRTLEHAALCTGESRVEPGSAEADIFIYPGFRFRVVQAMLTNFHLPQSTLLMLVCSLGGKDLVLRAYHHAVEQRYRFYSYGDCMFLE